jgi:SAM-dependent methyltransferase
MSFSQVEISRVRDYWNARPCNIRHSTAPVGTPQYFDEVEARKYFVEPHIPAFADFPRWRGQRVLEIGCGIGTDTINFARNGAQVTTVDVSEQSLALARKRAEIFGLNNKIRFCHGDAERLSAFVPVEPYDLIYSFGVIHHTPHPEAVLTSVQVEHIFPYRVHDDVPRPCIAPKLISMPLEHGATLLMDAGCDVPRTGAPRRLASPNNGQSPLNPDSSSLLWLRVR